MKIMAFLLLASALHVSANSYSQAKVSLSVKNSTVEEVLNALENQTGYTFFYKLGVFNNRQRVDVNVTEKELPDVLDEILPPLGLAFQVDDKVVIITPAKAAPQERRVITGTVTDASKTPIPGVTVRIKNTTFGASTDSKGEFRLGVPVGEETVLLFSFVGYRSLEVKITDDKPLSIIMEEAIQQVDEVVVTGYANIRKSSFTGTATRITREELQKVSTGNVLQSLQVFDPSLRTVRNNEMGSDPNTLPEFNIRGAAGIGIPELDRAQAADVSQFALKNNPNLPVFILDGHEVSTMRIYDMDPNRIESITILKDAAATAMYGSRAANGVIVIETVAPRPGELRMTYNATGTFIAPDLSSYNMMNAREKIEAEGASGMLADGSAYYQNLAEYRAKMNYVDRGVDTYWLSQPLRTQVNHRHSLYVEGGAESVRFGLGVNYDGEHGVMKGSYRDRMGADLRVDYRFKGIQITDNVTFTRMKSRQSPYGSFSTYARLPQYVSPYDLETGKAEPDHYFGFARYVNPLFDVEKRNFDRDGYYQFTNSLSVNAFFLDHFQLKFQLATAYMDNLGEQFIDPNSSKFATDAYTPFNRGELFVDESKTFDWNMNLMLMYNRGIREHNLNFNLALNANESKGKSSHFVYCGFPSGQLHDIMYANSLRESPTFSDDNSRLVGGLLTGNYTYKDTYLLDLSARVDGSSKFGSKQRFAPFWSLGTGINLHKYEFMQKYPAISSMRVKANYGQTGRVAFSPYAAQNTYRIMLDDWYTTGLGGALISMGNDRLSWDNGNTLNLGLDLRLWNRLMVNFSWYDKHTKNMVTSVTIPSSSGFTSYTENMGEVSNKGYEVMLNLAVVKSEDWNVNVAANGAHNKNKIVKISESLKEYNDRVDRYYEEYAMNYVNLNVNEKYARPIRKYEEGGSVYAIFGMKSLGISPENGAELFMRRDGTVTHDWDASEQVIIGNTEPALQGSFSLNARYKGFTLYSTFMYEFGGDLYNSTLVNNVESVDITKNNVDRRAMLMRWQKPGDLAPLKAITDRYVFTLPTSRFVQKNNTLTFNSLSLGYDMDQNLTKRLGLSMLRVQFTMNEIGVFSTIHQERGTSYPFARKFGFTLNANF
jgi:TonB-linked SusC/RagA family outer membrane protein